MNPVIIAKTKFVRISPRKVRLVARQLVGLSVVEAIARLEYLPNRSALPLTKLIKQAAGNAAAIHQFKNPVQLIIGSIMVGEGPTYKRFQPVSRGRAHSIKKRTSHITLAVKPSLPDTATNKPLNQSDTTSKVNKTVTK